MIEGSESGQSCSAPTTRPPLRGVLFGFLIAALGAAAILMITQLLDRYAVTLLALLLINAALAVSLTVANGLSGLFSLGHPAFMTIGAYCAAILTFPAARKGTMLSDLPEWLASIEWPMLPAVGAAGLLAGLVALGVGYAVLRLKGHYLAVATLGLIIVVQGLALNWDGITRGGSGLSGLPRHVDIWWAYAFLAIVAALAWRIKYSSLGRALLAVRENELAAECSGINAARLKILAFTLGAIIAGVGGALMAHLISVITPGTFSIVLAFNLVAMVVIGGAGSITGAILAASGIALVSESLRSVEESLNLYGLSQVVVALCLIAVLYVRPSGLFGSGEPGIVKRLLRGKGQP